MIRRTALWKRLRDFLIRRHGWVYLLTAGLWIAAASYVLTVKDVAVAPPAEKPKQPPMAGLSLSLEQPKNVNYEVFSSTDAEVTVSYLNEQGQATLVTGPSPWRLALSTRDVGFAAGVTALSTNDTVTCRISVDGKVIDEKTGAGSKPSVSCNLLAFRKIPGS